MPCLQEEPSSIFQIVGRLRYYRLVKVQPIDPTIQGLRLQYVEFFSKFLLTGGKRFKPFRKIGGEFA